MLAQTNWEVNGDQSCLGFDRTAACHQGAVPLYTVNATTIEHVQETVRFAAEHNIRLAIKNTGHDYLGRSTAASSLSLWVFHNKSISFSDDFVPDGADRGTKGIGAIILGPGVIWDDAYRAADEHGVTVVGGSVPTVGTSGGYCQGGGHSSLSHLRGLCADNVIQYKVVTADGNVKTANAFQNKDLFWALRGGGGGTFAVVVEAVYRAHPPLKTIQVATYQIYFKERETRFKLMKDWFSRQVSLSNDGWSGYAFIQDDFLKFVFSVADKDLNFAKKSFSSFLDYADSFEDAFVAGVINTYTSYWDAYAASKLRMDDKNAGMNAVIGSRLIPRRNMDNPDRAEELTRALMEAQDASRGYWNPNAYFLSQIVAGGAVANGSHTETSVHPAWRDAMMNVVFSSVWQDDLPMEEQLVIGRQLTKTIQVLRDITPGSGAYFNEADPAEPEWQSNYFGSNYPRLKKVKDSVDPQGLFLCNKCVGKSPKIFNDLDNQDDVPGKDSRLATVGEVKSALTPGLTPTCIDAQARAQNQMVEFKASIGDIIINSPIRVPRPIKDVINGLIDVMQKSLDVGVVNHNKEIVDSTHTLISSLSTLLNGLPSVPIIKDTVSQLVTELGDLKETTAKLQECSADIESV
ncbi:hypothetical protein EC968_006616 [Mortierella alpina]|nr:hypothetical protein EC968_006616 [Mortierella alpina]